MEMARRMGADHVIDFTKVDPVAEIMRLTAHHPQPSQNKAAPVTSFQSTDLFVGA